MNPPDGTVALRIAFNGALEDVPARPAPEFGAGAFELLACPGLAEGAAAGDVVVPGVDGSFTVLRRSGNLAIHAVAVGVDHQVMERAFSQELERIGGRLDGGIAGMRVYCVRIDVGFPAIQAACEAAAAACPGAQWMFANVYDVETGAVLPWVVERAPRE